MAIKPQPSSSLKTINQEKIIYEYLRNYIGDRSLEEIILEFHCLFVEGRSQNILVRDTIENIICSKITQEKFFYILNYCFYIVINYWLDRHEKPDCIFQLLQIFDNLDYDSKYYSRRKQKILTLTQEFVRSKHYAKLKRIAVIFESQSSLELSNQTTIKSLLPRYPFLYEYLAIGEGLSAEFTSAACKPRGGIAFSSKGGACMPRQENILEVIKLVRELQTNRTKSFEFRLSQHIIYRSRLIEIARAQQFSHGAGKIIRRIPNPTLLSDKDLRLGLKQYIKKIDSQITLYQLSRNFLVKNKQEITYRAFKRNLYRYLSFQIESKNPQYDFQEKLWQLLDNMYYQSDALPIDENLVFRTCRKLYQAFIINNAETNQHNLLIKLISNLGTAQTVMLLIKIVLICPQAKTDLQERLATLFSHYESKTIEDAPWIVKFLEYFLVAFSIYFGKIDLTLAKAL